MKIEKINLEKVDILKVIESMQSEIRLLSRILSGSVPLPEDIKRNAVNSIKGLASIVSDWVEVVYNSSSGN